MTHDNSPDEGHREDVADLELEWCVDHVFVTRLRRGKDIEESAKEGQIVAGHVRDHEDRT